MCETPVFVGDNLLQYTCSCWTETLIYWVQWILTFCLMKV